MNRLIAKCAAGAALFVVCGAATAQLVLTLTLCPAKYMKEIYGGDNPNTVCDVNAMDAAWSATQAAMQTTLTNQGVAANTAITALQGDRAKVSDVTDLTKLVKNLTETAARLEKKIKEAESQLAALEQRVDALKKP